MDRKRFKNLMLFGGIGALWSAAFIYPVVTMRSGMNKHLSQQVQEKIEAEALPDSLQARTFKYQASIYQRLKKKGFFVNHEDVLSSMAEELTALTTELPQDQNEWTTVDKALYDFASTEMQKAQQQNVSALDYSIHLAEMIRHYKPTQKPISVEMSNEKTGSKSVETANTQVNQATHNPVRFISLNNQNR